MTILLTGGAGFIGSNFVHSWLGSTDERVVNVDRLTYAGNLLNLAGFEKDSRHVFVRGDICDRQAMLHLLMEHRPRAVLNFAAETHVDRSIHGPGEFIQTNVVGTYNLLEAARAYWSELPETVAGGHTSEGAVDRGRFRFLHVSTDEVYGSLLPEDPPFSEANPYLPNSPYSASKAASDHLVRAWCHTYGVPVLTTNCSNNYGPRQFPEKLIPLVIINALAGKELPVYGDGLQVRDWLYVNDHCRAVALVLERGRVGETYNIGGHCEVANLEVVKTVCQVLDEIRPRADGDHYASQIAFVRDRPGHDRRYAIDSRKIERELSWQPAESLVSGIRKTVLWYLENPAWVNDVVTGSYRQWIERQYG